SQRRGHVDDGHKVVAVAHEARIVPHANLNVEVARRPTAFAGVTATPDPDALTVGDSGRHIHGQLHALRLVTATMTFSAGLRRDAAVAAAPVADGRPHHLTERSPRDGPQ